MPHRTSGTSTIPPPSDTLTRPEAINSDEVLRRLAPILRARDIESVWSDTVSAMRSLGFVHVTYGYSPDSRGPVLGAYEDSLILSTLPRADLAEMLQRGLAWQSRSFTWAMQNAGVRAWSIGSTDDSYDIAARSRVTPEGQSFFERVGLQAGVTVGFARARIRGTAVMGLSVPRGVTRPELDAWLKRAEQAIFVLAKVAHQSLSGLPWNRPSGDLTFRQREVLEWVAEGKTTADIAVILGLTAATVEKHLRLARQCLGVETTAHALIKATFLNQVFVRPSAPLRSTARSR